MTYCLQKINITLETTVQLFTYFEVLNSIKVLCIKKTVGNGVLPTAYMSYTNANSVSMLYLIY